MSALFSTGCHEKNQLFGQCVLFALTGTVFFAAERRRAQALYCLPKHAGGVTFGRFK